MKSHNEIINSPGLLVLDSIPEGGYGELFILGKRWASVVWSTGAGWEHVSVAPYKRSHTPTWDEMCKVKEMFFKDEEAVVQFHPPKSEHVNNMPNCLHLWRPTAEILPLPPSILVGIKGLTYEDLKKAASEVMK